MQYAFVTMFQRDQFGRCTRKSVHRVLVFFFFMSQSFTGVPDRLIEPDPAHFFTNNLRLNVAAGFQSIDKTFRQYFRSARSFVPVGTITFDD